MATHTGDSRSDAKRAIHLVLALAMGCMGGLCLCGQAPAAEVPDPTRVAQIAAWLPAKCQGVGRPITDRQAWQVMGQHTAWRNIIGQADRLLAEAMPVLTEDLYLDYSKTGNRTRYQAVYGKVQDRLETLALAECLQDRGRYLPSITEVIRHLCGFVSWTMPAHDKSLSGFQRQGYVVDLGASHISWMLATTESLLGDRLESNTRTLLRENVLLRVLDPIRFQIEGKTKSEWWFNGTNNWNAVCLANCSGAALALVEDQGDRAFFVAAAEHYIRNFLRGFGSDGYCTEGLGYWNYGYGHFVLLTETLCQATQGRLDLLDLPGARPPAEFGWQIQMAPGISPAFADCSITAKPDPQILYYLSRRLGIPMGQADFDPVSPGGRLPGAMIYSFANTASRQTEVHRQPVLQIRTWFDTSGVLIARPYPGTACRMAVALKGGHNDEHHNHNDLGSYCVTVDGKGLLTDPGSEVYTARTFSKDRYLSKALNSFGHPVPVVAGRLQQTGRQAQAKVLDAAFTDLKDTLVLDITSAYKADDVREVLRTFEYTRQDQGSLTVQDCVRFTQTRSFETALVTFGEVLRQDKTHLQVTNQGSGLMVTIDTQGRDFDLTQEVLEEDFSAKKRPTRVGIKLTEPVTEAKVLTTIRPTPAHNDLELPGIETAPAVSSIIAQ